MLGWIVGFALLGSAGAVGAAALLLVVPPRVRERIVPALVSYATGVLLAAALLALLPEALAAAPARPVLETLLAGLVVFFLLERVAIWSHSLRVGARHESHASAGTLVLIGDALHNAVDGVVVAAAFTSSVPLGIATGLAAFAHEVPQELGDFAILLESGFTPGRAVVWNLVSGSVTLPAAVAAYLALDLTRGAVPYVLALAAASFLYIGLADLVPGLHDRSGSRFGWREIALLLLGVASIVSLGA
ncbi:MAG: ZIP family metal transporter [Candidatus Binatia bacterium]